MLIIGIDPGQTGAIAAMWGHEILRVEDMPTIPRPTTSKKKSKEVNGSALASLLMDMRVPGKPITIMLEKVHAMPRQGVTSTFNFGEGFGIVKGVVATLQYPLILVTPQEWKKRAGLIGEEKDEARLLAIRRFPNMADRLKRKKDGGRADAICIAHFGNIGN